MALKSHNRVISCFKTKPVYSRGVASEISTADEDESSPSMIRGRRLASIRKAYEDGRPLSYFQKLPTKDVIESGIPIEELEKNGLLKTVGKDIPQKCGVREMAKLLNKIYPRSDNREIYPMQVSNALSKEGAPGYNKNNNQISTAIFLPWWKEKHFDGAPSASKLADAAAAAHDREIIERDRAQIKLDNERREQDERWMQKADAQMTVTGAVLAHHAFVKNRLAKFPQKLNPSDFTVEQMQKINASLFEVLRELEDDCANPVEAK